MQLFKVTAPTRVDLAGGTLDIWPLYCLLSGEMKTINFAIDLFVQATFEVTEAADFSLKIQIGSLSAELKSPVDRAQLALFRPELQFPVFVMSEWFRQFPPKPQRHILITVASSVPAGSGLGGSSALCVALVRGASRMTLHFNDQGWQWELMRWARDVEARFLQMATGTQDYLASLFGGISCFVSRLGNWERVSYSDALGSEISQRMLVLFSGQVHQSGLSNSEIFKRALEGEKEVMQGLKGISDVASSLDQELRLSRRDWKSIGQLLNAEWRIRRELFHVNTPRLDELMTSLQHQRILGAKVCGAAGGGSIIVVSEPDARASLISHCEKNNVQILTCQPTDEGVSIRA